MRACSPIPLGMKRSRGKSLIHWLIIDHSIDPILPQYNSTLSAIRFGGAVWPAWHLEYYNPNESEDATMTAKENKRYIQIMKKKKKKITTLAACI